MSSRWLACLPGLDVRGSKHSWRCTAWPFRRGRSSDDTPLRDQSRLERHTIQRNILATSVVAAHCATPLLLRQVIYCGICGNFQKPLAEMVISEAGPHLFLELDCSQLLSDIPQVACRLTSSSPDFARWASVFRPERCLSSRKRPKSGGSSLEPAAFWPGRAAFPRGRRTCPAAFVQLGHGSWSCA
jgi:hypothetical protein